MNDNQTVEFISENKHLKTIYKNNYESRGLSINNLVTDAYHLSNKPDFNFIVYTGDFGQPIFDKTTYYFFTYNDNFEKTVPDFMFDAWPETGVIKYEETMRNIITNGQKKPESNLVGWIGATSSSIRKNLLSLVKTDESLAQHANFIEMCWNRSHPQALYKNTSAYISIPDQVKRWRYLIDIEGSGWSARLKLFLFSNRATFIVDRPCKEYWLKDIKPWIHYIPIKRDLSDFKENLGKIMQDGDLEEYIKQEAYNFATNNLQKEHAVNYYTNLINNL